MLGCNLDGSLRVTNAGLRPDFPYRALPHLYALSQRTVRYIVYAQHNDGRSAVIKGPDDYDFRHIIADMREIRDAGMYVYASMSAAWPRWMSEGQPAYEMYHSWVSDPTTSDADLTWAGPDGSRWRLATPTERPCMWHPNIPHIDGAQVEAFSYAFASECADLIDYVGPDNERGGRAYWPPVQAPPYEVAYARAFDEVIIPFARGYRRGCTGGVATIVGPEADVESGIGYLCALEQERGYRVYDVLSHHPGYSWGSPYLEKALARSDEFMSTARKWALGRPIWSTEGWDFVADNGQMVDLFMESERRYPDLRGQFLFHPELVLFQDGARWNDKGFPFKLSAHGERWKRWVDGRETTKRRSVSK